MSPNRLLLPLLFALGVGGCSGGAGEPGHASSDEHDRMAHESEGSHDTGPGPDREHGHAAALDPEGGAVLRIRAEMLRDLRVTTGQVAARPGGDGVIALGEIRVDEGAYAEVGPPVEARVVGLLASVGDRLRAGQPLVELQSAELGRARAAFLSAQARALAATKQAERKRGLLQDRIVSEREAQEAEADRTSAEAELRAARAALQALGVPTPEGESGIETTDASRFLLRSPIAGTVLTRTAVRGREADPDEPLYRVADLSKVWMIAQAFERDAVRVHEGAEVTVRLPALPGREFRGRVDLIGQEVETGSRTLPVRVVLENPDGALRPGMSASAWLPLGDGAGPVVAVPAASLQRVKDGWHVFVPRGDGAFEMRPVGRGRDLGGEVEVLSGLEPGETVVVDGAFLLKAEHEKAQGGGEEHQH